MKGPNNAWPTYVGNSPALFKLLPMVLHHSINGRRVHSMQSFPKQHTHVWRGTLH